MCGGYAKHVEGKTFEKKNHPRHFKNLKCSCSYSPRLLSKGSCKKLPAHFMTQADSA